MNICNQNAALIWKPQVIQEITIIKLGESSVHCVWEGLWAETFWTQEGFGEGDAFHKDLSERGQMEKDAKCMIQFTVLFKKHVKLNYLFLDMQLL